MRVQAAPTRVTSTQAAPAQMPNASNGKVLLTRRHFLYGALGVGALAAIGGGTVAIGSLQKNDSSEISVLEVPEESVTTSDALTEVDASSSISLKSSFELPYGTLVWANDDSVAACLLPTDQAKPLAQVGLLFLESGSSTVALPQAVGQDEGFEIYDVRACSTGIVWTEADILDGMWRVYSASLDQDAIGEPQLLEEGTSVWETPTIAATAGFAFWQVLPRADGPMRAEVSRFMRAAFGSSETSVVYESHGRMCTPPYALSDSVVITPRTDTSSVHHQLTRIDARTGEVLDAMILPTSMKPLEAGYGNTGFMFSFDAIYSYGEGIANLGTYVPAQQVAAANADGIGNAAYSDARWFRHTRTPTAAPAWCGRYLMVKSSTTIGIDLENNTYFALDIKSGADDYGEYLASTGMGSTAVTFSNIDYQPLAGEAQKYCLVRVWEAIS